MSYIGQGLPADTFQGFVTDSFTGDGSATTFTLSKEPFSEDTLIVVINNVIQKPTTNFTVSGTTLTIVGTAVASGDVIYAIHMGGPLPIGGASELDLNGASDKLILDADADTTISADTDDQIDFKLGGSDIATLTTSSLTLKNSATADNSTFTLNLQTAESDIAADDVIGKIAFAAPSEGTGTDANLTAAAIQARSEGDFSSSSNATELQFMTGASEAATTKMTLSSNGLLGIGTDAPQRFLHIVGTDGTTSLSEGNSRTTLFLDNDGANYINIAAANDAASAVFFSDSDANNVGGLNYNHDGNVMSFTVNGSERARFLASGSLAVGTTSIQQNAMAHFKGGEHSYFAYKFETVQTSNNAYNMWLYNNYAGNSASQEFLRGQDPSAVRFFIATDGGFYGNGTYGSVSDERIKQDITDANSQWDDIKALKVRNFKKKVNVRDYGDDALVEIGLVAQEVEKVSPKLIEETLPDNAAIISDSTFGTLYTEEDDLPSGVKVGDVKSTKENVKAIKYSIVHMKALKALQEAMAKIETLETKVKALEDA